MRPDISAERNEQGSIHSAHCEIHQHLRARASAQIEAHDNVVTRLSRKIKAAKDDLPLKIKVTACEAVGDANEGDILLFPQYMRYALSKSSLQKV